MPIGAYIPPTLPTSTKVGTPTKAVAKVPLTASRPTYGVTPTKPAFQSPIDVTSLNSGGYGVGSQLSGQGQPGGSADPYSFLDQLDPITAEAIRAALAAVDAEYGLQQAELEGGQGVLGAEKADYFQQLGVAQGNALTDVDNEANRRGIYQSSIRLSNRAETLGRYGRQEALAEVEYGNSLASIQRALDALDANQRITALAQVEQIIEAQGNADIALGVDGLLAEGEEFVGSITLEDIRAYLAETA